MKVISQFQHTKKKSSKSNNKTNKNEEDIFLSSNQVINQLLMGKEPSILVGESSINACDADAIWRAVSQRVASYRPPTGQSGHPRLNPCRGTKPKALRRDRHLAAAQANSLGFFFLLPSSGQSGVPFLQRPSNAIYRWARQLNTESTPRD